MDSTTTSRRSSCFTEEGDGLAFIADMEVGLHRRGSFRNSSSSMRNRPYFLEACFLCEKSLCGGNKDIFMYRGDIPFCSDDCRQEQIEIEELKEKKLWNLSLRRRKGRRNSTSPNESRSVAAAAAGGGGDYPFHKGAVVA